MLAYTQYILNRTTTNETIKVLDFSRLKSNWTKSRRSADIGISGSANNHNKRLFTMQKNVLK